MYLYILFFSFVLVVFTSYFSSLFFSACKLSFTSFSFFLLSFLFAVCSHFSLFSYRIEVGEIFLLMSQIDEEWGWGRSQASGQNGLIPIVIMEDVVGVVGVAMAKQV